MLNTLNNTVARVQPNGSPCANNHCSTRYEQSFRHNKHTHTNQKADTIQHSRHNHEVHQGTQSLDNTEITHPYNGSLKLVFLKVASSHPYYLSFTLHIYHHPEHQFRSCLTQMTSPTHLQARVQPRNTYNHAYIQFLPEQNITISH